MYNLIIKPKIIFFILFVLIILLAFGVTVFKKSPPQVTPIIPENTILPPTPTPTPDPLYVGWESYISQNLGMSFFYPQALKNYNQGELSETFRPLEKASQICINLSGCSPTSLSVFQIHATSVGYKPKRGFSFSDIVGFRQEDSSFYVQFPDDSEMKIADGLAALIDTRYNQKILVIKGFPADSIGAILPKPFPDISAIVIEMQLTDDLTEPDFQKMLNSINFPYYNTLPSDEEIQKETLPPRYADATIKSSIEKIAKIINCRYSLDGSYPITYYPDYLCGGATVIINPVIQKPYYYLQTNSGSGFVIKARLSTGYVYTVTEENFPPPTPIPSPTPRPTR